MCILHIFFAAPFYQNEAEADANAEADGAESETETEAGMPEGWNAGMPEAGIQDWEHLRSQEEGKIGNPPRGPRRATRSPMIQQIL